MHSLSPSSPPPAPLEVRLLGGWEVVVHGKPLAPLRSRKGKWLFAFLVLRGRLETERDWLAQEIWDDVEDLDDARRSLRVSLSDLRRVLGVEAGRVESSGTALRLDLRGAAVDVSEFDSAVARDDPVSLERAVELYRGPLLADCGSAWVLLERERRHSEYVRALTRLAAHALGAGSHGDAARWLGCLVAAEPGREDHRRELMRAYVLAGEPQVALETYRSLEAWLRRGDPLAVPQPMTLRLFQSIRDESRRPGVTPATEFRVRQPPAPMGPLVGRVREGDELFSRLFERRLVTLSGVGGVGKTSLAQEVAPRFAAAHQVQAAWVELADVRSADSLADTVAAALGWTESGGKPWDVLLAQRLEHVEILLVLDNCEHLLTACRELITALLARCPGLRILTTSRQNLGVYGESVQVLEPLSLLAEGGWPSEAVSLFVTRAAETGTWVPSGSKALGAAAEICASLDGLPLAIELAAIQTRDRPVEAIAAEVTHRFRLLRDQESTRPERHQTMERAIDWSYALLSPEAPAASPPPIGVRGRLDAGVSGGGLR